MRKKRKTYISLFSSAGVGCYGFKQAGFECVATSELLEKRLNIQKYNEKCKYNSGYISGDLSDTKIKNKIFMEISKWKTKEKTKEIDVLIATPPCQGMSVANHKKNNEQKRNSLIVESIILTKEIKPRFFIFENVRAFLKTICTNVDKEKMTIEKAIDLNLAGEYTILKKVINFKDYGSASSRTRSLVIGVRKDIKNISPFDIFPKEAKEKSLKEIIGRFPSLKTMGEIDPKDIFHSFREYDKKMLPWVENTEEGKTAFDNKSPKHIPHTIKNGKIIPNTNKNGDKYKRCEWNKVAPCIHTRNDILASQSTIHPKDNRVFSVRELMEIMTIPKSFRWTFISEEKLNNLSLEDKKKFIKKFDITIRQSIGEAVPTSIFKTIAENINKYEAEETQHKNTSDVKGDINMFVKNHINKTPYSILSRIVEVSNANKNHTSAFYTSKNICYTLIKELPDFSEKENISILEPSVGMGNFIPLLVERYKNKKINLDVVDIDKNILNLLKIIIEKQNFPNLNITYINEDFLSLKTTKKYDVVIGNPPFGKIFDKEKLSEYRKNYFNNKTSNTYPLFLEKSILLGDYVAMITPKSLLSAPEYNKTREFIQQKCNVKTIIDYGEKGFEKVKIETISLLLKNKSKKEKSLITKIESFITKTINFMPENNLYDKDFNFWIIYKNSLFEKVKRKMFFDIYDFHRDRQITKRITKKIGNYRVLKSRNIGINKTINIKDYDSFVDNLEKLNVKKYINKDLILVPNLSYNPRACFQPKNAIADGSVALLNPKNGFNIDLDDLEYYATEEFREFYMIGRNLGTRSLNIDSNSIKLWGIQKGKHKNEHKRRNK